MPAFFVRVRKFAYWKTRRAWCRKVCVFQNQEKLARRSRKFPYFKTRKSCAPGFGKSSAKPEKLRTLLQNSAILKNCGNLCKCRQKNRVSENVQTLARRKGAKKILDKFQIGIDKWIKPSYNPNRSSEGGKYNGTPRH